MKLLKAKKGAYNLEQLLSVGMVFVATAIGLAFGAKVLSEISDDLYASDANGTAFNIVENGTEALNVLGKWLPTIALIAVAALIVSLVVGAFYVMGNK